MSERRIEIIINGPDTGVVTITGPVCDKLIAFARTADKTQVVAPDRDGPTALLFAAVKALLRDKPKNWLP